MDRINFKACEDTSNNKPHFKGFISVGDKVYEFGAWPAKNGNGFSGKVRPKGERSGQGGEATPEEAA